MQLLVNLRSVALNECLLASHSEGNCSGSAGVRAQFDHVTRTH
jgi:hypothetical protein